MHYEKYHCVKSVQIQSFFWSLFFCIRTEYGDLRSKYPYSVRIQENTDQKKLRIWTFYTQCIITLLCPEFSKYGNRNLVVLKNSQLSDLHLMYIENVKRFLFTGLIELTGIILIRIFLRVPARRFLQNYINICFIILNNMMMQLDV